MQASMERSLMLVTALNPIIGYDQAAKVAQEASKKNISLKEASVRLGLMTEKAFDKAVNPKNMLKPNLK